ncbi:DOG1-like protein 4 [Tanacetum coccineum]
MTNTTPIEEKFSDFYEKWVSQLEEYLRFLVQEYSHESDYENLVAKLTTHHKNYYRFKWAAAHEDVCAFFTPVWLTPLENAYLWVTGWKPSVLFRFLTALVDLSEEQVKKIEGLRVKIKMDGKKWKTQLEKAQVSMADRRTVEIVTCGGADVAGVLTGLEKVMKMGDCVRLKAIGSPIMQINTTDDEMVHVPDWLCEGDFHSVHGSVTIEIPLRGSALHTISKHMTGPKFRSATSKNILKPQPSKETTKDNTQKLPRKRKPLTRRMPQQSSWCSRGSSNDGHEANGGESRGGRQPHYTAYVRGWRMFPNKATKEGPSTGSKQSHSEGSNQAGRGTYHERSALPRLALKPIHGKEA